MSTPLGQQPPPLPILQQPLSTHSTHGSIGPVIAVLVVIIILGILAVMVGRLCSGRRTMRYGQYDIEGWAETKCSSCIDGRISQPTPRPNASATSTPASGPVQDHNEIKQEDHFPPPQPLENPESLASR